ncbi:universal stress protein [Tellurirhabdus bombi]|uniref:universal stress protein n=1 Tax=Tellurirhabdus bombi TaxID=2907205 RepID=UPI001F2D37AC|nr:universal stress protein [Tellurirhabdus bombi]
MKNILIPTDFSESAEHALKYAQMLARLDGATLTLTHVTQPFIPDTTLPTGDIGIGVGALAAQEMEEISESQLQQLAARLQQEGFTCQTESRMGSVEDEIIALADEQRPDMIVIGRHNFDSFFDRLTGSAASDVAMQAHCPVLVVPSPEEAQGAAIQFKHIVYATQLEFDENHILRPVVDLVRRNNARLTLLKINADNQPDVNNSQEFMAQIKQEFGQERFSEDVVHADNVSEGLTGYIKTHQVDLLVMVTRERDFMSRLLNPSLTKRMVLSSSVPVLVYHAGDTKGADFL